MARNRSPAERLASLRKQIDDATQRKAELDGIVKSQRAELKREFGCSTAREAKAVRAKLVRKKAEAEAAISSLLDDIEESMA